MIAALTKPTLQAITLAILAVGTAAAQSDSRDRSWVHESWTAKDGLPVNSVSAALQDRAGYIWAATFDGLARFDGVRFTVFNTSNSAGLPRDRFIDLKEGRDGSLWLATDQLEVIRYRNGEFTTLTFEGGRPGERVNTLLVDSIGTVWVGTTRGLWMVRGDRVVPVARGTVDGYVASISQRRDGTVVVAPWGVGLFHVSGDGHATKLALDRSVDADTVMSTFEDATGRLWIVGKRGIWSWKDRLQKMMSLGPTRFGFQNAVEIPATGEVIAATGAGVYRLSPGELSRIAPPARTPNTGYALWTDGKATWTLHDGDVFRDGRRVFSLLERQTVATTFVDREGSLWLGTDTGLHRLVRALVTTYSIPEGVAHSSIYPTYVDRSGAAWLGTWGNGASRVDPVTGRVTNLAAGIHAFVNSFFEDETGRLWIGGGQDRGNGGVYLCTITTMTCRIDGSPEMRGNAVYALHGDADGRLWAGAVNGLFRYDGRSWTRLPTSSGAPNALVRAFADTRDGAIWMGTNGSGLFRYREGAFTSLTRRDGLPSDLIRSLYQDADGWLWVGTEGRGLARLDPRAWSTGTSAAPNADRRIVRIGRENGLYDEVIHQILEDDTGRLWMNTNRGIFWVSRAELNAFAEGRVSAVHSVSYTERDGMRHREGNGGVQPAGAKGPDGRMWFPTQDGVVVIDPATVRSGRGAPPVVVEHVVVGGKSLRIERDSIALAPDQRDVQIDYTALTFLQPANVRFRYRLEGYDAGWVDAGNRRTAFYTKLPPRRYTFRVEATDAPGTWRDPGVALALDVRPKIWETDFVRWSYVAALGMLLLLALRIREARLRARAAELEQVVDERTAALRERERELADRNEDLQSLDRAKTHFFANVSHELRTPLTLTIGPLEDLRTRANGDPQVERWLDIALRNSRRLLRLVNQLLDVAKLDAKAMHLTPRSVDLTPFTRGVVGAFASVAERKGIRLGLEAPPIILGVFDTDAVEKILTNLISNAIKFTPSGGAVDIALASEGDLVRLVVRDSGPGISPSRLPHVFERFHSVDESGTQPGTGIGLSLVKELVELHGGTITVESGSAGTTFTATLRPLATPEVAVDAAHLLPSPQSLVPSPQGQSVASSPDEVDDVPTLLVVDDSADLRSYIRDHFATRFRVIEAGDGAEGIELARRHLPDVIVSDVMMPNTDGHELVRVLRGSSETNFLSIILLTAQAGDEQRLAALERGADEYLTKPFEMRELDVRIRNLVESRRRLRERFTTQPPASSAADAGLAPDDRAYVARVREAIQRGLGDPNFGVGELADALAQDRSRVFRRIRDILGEPPSLLIRRMRLEEGARLLDEGSGTVSDVAYAVGFNSVSYFCRCFQETHGVTPAAYRSRAAE